MLRNAFVKKSLRKLKNKNWPSTIQATRIRFKIDFQIPNTYHVTLLVKLREFVK